MAQDPSPGGRLLVVVGREDLARYERFKHVFASEPMDVVLDRRWGERRRHPEPVGDRRRGDRRAQIRSEIRVPVNSDIDVVSARRKGRELAAAAKLPATDAALVATAVSSLARHIVSFVQRGALILRVIENRDALGMEVVAVSGGPDTPGASPVIETGQPMSSRLYQWLVGVQHLVEEFHTTCELAPGNPIAIRRWRS